MLFVNEPNVAVASGDNGKCWKSKNPETFPSSVVFWKSPQSERTNIDNIWLTSATHPSCKLPESGQTTILETVFIKQGGISKLLSVLKELQDHKVRLPTLLVLQRFVPGNSMSTFEQNTLKDSNLNPHHLSVLKFFWLSLIYFWKQMAEAVSLFLQVLRCWYFWHAISKKKMRRGVFFG